MCCMNFINLQYYHSSNIKSWIHFLNRLYSSKSSLILAIILWCNILVSIPWYSKTSILILTLHTFTLTQVICLPCLDLKSTSSCIVWSRLMSPIKLKMKIVYMNKNYLISFMAPDRSLLFPSNFKSLAENTRNSPFLHPTAINSPSILKATERAALTANFPTKDCQKIAQWYMFINSEIYVILSCRVK